MFAFSSTSDKVMAIILENQDMPVQELINVIKSRLKLSQAEIDSVIADLSKQNFITTLYADDELYALHPQPHALSQLINKRETLWESRFWKFAPIVISLISLVKSFWPEITAILQMLR